MSACPTAPLVVGLVGGVASGKSAVARAFEDHGFVRIDADHLAREVAGRPEVRAALAARFGPGVFDADGDLDRARLAAIVFADPAARAELEAITHPPIRRAIEAALDEARRAGRPVVLDVPLLVEGGLVERCDEVVFVDAPDELRRERARARGWDPRELERREASQAPLSVKKARATASISSVGSLDRTRDQVARLLAAWTARGPTRT